ncbi:MAG: DPP IV N-terminal domain-containing protein [Bacteroidota bacterium]|nr:DPP IV N-terminal domain-containing protein [Bacteroidota bacterium]
MKIILILLIFITSSLFSQITLEDIWLTNKYNFSKTLSYKWGPSDSYFDIVKTKQGAEIQQLSLKSNKKIRTIATTKELILPGDSIQLDFDDFQIDGNYILFQCNTISIYRRSWKSKFWLFNIKTKTFSKIANGEYISYPDFSPNGKSIAYVKSNNLWIYNIESQIDISITSNGKKNEIINGTTDWVYEEEFEFVKGFEWSPDARFLAFYQFDESKVKEYTMQIWNDVYPTNYVYKYPKAGEENSKVKILIYDAKYKETFTAYDFAKFDNYVPRINWAPKSVLSVRELSRSQDTLTIFHYSALSGLSDTLIQFTDPAYIEVDDNFIYTDSLLFFLSENGGYKHIYSFNIFEKKLKQVTRGNFEIKSINAIDSVNRLIYYTSNEGNSTQTKICKIDFNGLNKYFLTTFSGYIDFELNPNNTFIKVDYQNSITPPQTKLFQISGNKTLYLKSEFPFSDSLKPISPVFNPFINNDKDTLNYYLIFPPNYNINKKYPVLLYVYGGPGSQEVLDQFPSSRDWWHQYLAQTGIIIACLDGRGTGGKGAYLKKCTTLKLGQYEVEDQIAFAKYLSKKSYIDSTRIGIWGWSFGGYLSSLSLLLGNDIFKLAIAVAPVTNWRFYDTIYTERFLKNPTDNAIGYDSYSPVNLADKLKGNFLLIHGTSDDNVHIQNTFEFQKSLIKSNKFFETFIYPNKAHGISGNTTRLHLFRTMTQFLQKKL